MVKTTHSLTLGLQDLQDKAFDKLKKRFPEMNEKLLRKKVHDAIAELAEKGNGRPIEYFLKESR